MPAARNTRREPKMFAYSIYALNFSLLTASLTTHEVLYPPLTFLRATGQKQTIVVGDGSVTIMNVVPSM